MHGLEDALGCVARATSFEALYPVEIGVARVRGATSLGVGMAKPHIE